MRLAILSVSAFLGSTLGSLATEQDTPPPVDQSVKAEEPQSTSAIPEPTATLLAGLGGLGLLFFATRRKV